MAALLARIRVSGPTLSCLHKFMRPLPQDMSGRSNHVQRRRLETTLKVGHVRPVKIGTLSKLKADRVRRTDVLITPWAMRLSRAG